MSCMLTLFKKILKRQKKFLFFFYEVVDHPSLKFETLFGGTIVDMYHIQNVMVPEWSKGEGETPPV